VSNLFLSNKIFIIKEEHPLESYDMGDIHDSILYAHSDDPRHIGETVKYYGELVDAITESGMGINEEAQQIIDRVNYDIEGLKGINKRVSRLLEIVTEGLWDE
jgi:hypothetical protein